MEPTTVSSNTYASDASGIWYVWCDTGTSATTTGNVWVTWCTSSSGTSNNVTTPVAYGIVEPETEEQRLAREERRREVEREERQRKLKQAIARRKAKSLLRDCLTATQRLQLKATGGFIVRAQSGKHYRIERGHAGNVIELDGKGQAIAKLCAHMDSRIPDEDHMLVQKLMLETCEAKFLQTANRRSFRSEQTYLEPMAV